MTGKGYTYNAVLMNWHEMKKRARFHEARYRHTTAHEVVVENSSSVKIRMLRQNVKTHPVLKSTSGISLKSFLRVS